MIENFASWFLQVAFYRTIRSHDLSHEFWKLVKFDFGFFRLFFLIYIHTNIHIQFLHSTLGYWAFNFMIFVAFLYLGLFQSHSSSCKYFELTLTNSCFLVSPFITWFAWELTSIILFIFFCMRLSLPHKQAMSSTY